MKKKIIMAILLLLALGCGIIFIPGIIRIPMLFFSVNRAMEKGQKYMDSLTYDDLIKLFALSDRMMEAYDSTERSIGYYGSFKTSRPVPESLSTHGIQRIDVDNSFVRFVWAGGLDHTYLKVSRMGENGYTATAVYNDDSSRIIYQTMKNNNDFGSEFDGQKQNTTGLSGIEGQVLKYSKTLKQIEYLKKPKSVTVLRRYLPPFFCGYASTAALTICASAEKDTIAIISLCDMDTTMKQGETIKAIPCDSIPFGVEIIGNNTDSTVMYLGKYNSFYADLQNDSGKKNRR